MKTRWILCALLCAAILLTLIPAVAFAAPSGSVYVGGVELTNGEYTTDGINEASTALPADGYAHFSTDTGTPTLTLKNFRYTGVAHVGTCIYANGDLAIVLTDGSTNSVTSTAGDAIYCAGELTLSGTGSLIAAGGTDSSSSGIYTQGELEITDSSVTSTSNNTAGTGYGVYCSQAITISGGSLTGTSKTGCGVNAGGALTLSNSATLGGTSDKGDGVFCVGKLTVTGSTLTATGGTDSSAHGLSISSGSMELTNSSVTGTSNTTAGSGYGVHCNGAVTVNGGRLKGTSKTGYGMYCAGTLTLSGSATLEGTSDKGSGVACGGKLTVSDTATLTATGGTRDSANGLHVDGADIELTGGSITGTSTLAYGVDCTGAVTVSGGLLKGTSGGDRGVRVGGALTLSGSARLEGSAEESHGVQALGALTLSGSSKLTGSSTLGVGVACGGKLTVSDAAELIATSGTDTDIHGLNVGAEGMEITGGTVRGTSKATGGSGRGINCAGAATISGGSLIGTSEVSYGMYYGGALTLSGSATLEGTSTKGTGVYCATGKLTVSGTASLTATGGTNTSTHGLYVGSGGIELRGGSVRGTSKTTVGDGLGIKCAGAVSANGGSLIGTSKTAHGVNTGALTLSGSATLTGSSQRDNGINANGALTLSGSSTLEGSSDLHLGVLCSGKLTVSDTAALTATGGTDGSFHGLQVGGAIELTGGSVTGTSNAETGTGFGVSCTGNVTVSNASLSGTSKTGYGICTTAGAITLSGSAELTGTCTGTSIGGTGVYCPGSVSVSDTAAFTATTSAPDGYGLMVGGITVSDSGSVTCESNATTGDGYGIWSIDHDAFTLTGGSLTGTSKASIGVYCGAITLSGDAVFTGTSDVKRGVDCDTLDVSGNAFFTATGGTTAGEKGLMADGAITISGGTVMLKGENGAVNKAPDLNGYTAAHQVTASRNVNGSSPESYAAAQIANYKYLRIVPLYTVTYNANLGTGSMTAGTAIAGTPFALPDCTFTPPAGKGFKEWAVGGAESTTRVSARDTHTFTADTVVYAVWQDLTAALTGGSASFTAGAAAQDAVFTIGTGVPGFSIENYDHTVMGSETLTSQQVSAATGSIVLTFNKDYLNTLSAGTHTAAVYLKGTLYADITVPIVFTVTSAPPAPAPTPAPPAPAETDPDSPEMGDGASPWLWEVLALAAGAVIAACVIFVSRRRRS